MLLHVPCPLPPVPGSVFLLLSSARHLLCAGEVGVKLLKTGLVLALEFLQPLLQCLTLRELGLDEPLVFLSVAVSLERDFHLILLANGPVTAP